MCFKLVLEVGVLYRGRIGLVDAMNSGGIPDSCRKLHSVSVWNIGGIGHFPPEFIETSNRNGTSWLSVTRTRSGGIGINILALHRGKGSHLLWSSPRWRFELAPYNYFLGVYGWAIGFIYYKSIVIIVVALKVHLLISDSNHALQLCVVLLLSGIKSI